VAQRVIAYLFQVAAMYSEAKTAIEVSYLVKTKFVQENWMVSQSVELLCMSSCKLPCMFESQSNIYSFKQPITSWTYILQEVLSFKAAFYQVEVLLQLAEVMRADGQLGAQLAILMRAQSQEMVALKKVIHCSLGDPCTESIKCSEAWLCANGRSHSDM